MEATQKEQNTLLTATQKLLCVFAMCFTLVFCSYKAFEYRTISWASVTRPLNTSWQMGADRNCMIVYSVSITSTLSLSGGQSGTVNLQTSPDNVTWTTVATTTNNNTGTLVIGLNTSAAQTATLSTVVRAGYYVRLQTVGTSTFTWVNGTDICI